MILGVAAIWDYRKGLDAFIELSQYLDERYKIILVGLNEKQIEKLPDTILGVASTNTVNQLRGLYAIADVFFNPTIEDNYPTTNLEAISCGTPVITYDTGGSPESAKKFGITICADKIVTLKEIIQGTTFKKDKIDDFDQNTMVLKYLELYNAKK